MYSVLINRQSFTTELCLVTNLRNSPLTRKACSIGSTMANQLWTSSVYSANNSNWWSFSSLVSMMLVSKGHVHISVQWTNITEASVMSGAIISKSINSYARNLDWGLCSVTFDNHAMYHPSLWDNKVAKENNLLLSIVSMHNGQSEEIEYCLLKGVFVAHAGLQLSFLLHYAQMIHSWLKAEGTAALLWGQNVFVNMCVYVSIWWFHFMIISKGCSADNRERTAELFYTTQLESSHWFLLGLIFLLQAQGHFMKW